MGLFNLRVNFYSLRTFVLILDFFFCVLFLLSLRFGQISPLAFFRWFTATSDRNDESCNRIPSNYCLPLLLCLAPRQQLWKAVITGNTVTRLMHTSTINDLRQGMNTYVLPTHMLRVNIRLGLFWLDKVTSVAKGKSAVRLLRILLVEKGLGKYET